MPHRIAVVTTIYRYLSHAQHIADRFLVGYPHAGQWHRPDMKVVFLEEWSTPDDRIKGVTDILRELAVLAETRKAA